MIETAVQMLKQMQYFEENRYNLTLVNDYVVILQTILQQPNLLEDILETRFNPYAEILLNIISTIFSDLNGISAQTDITS